MTGTTETPRRTGRKASFPASAIARLERSKTCKGDELTEFVRRDMKQIEAIQHELLQRLLSEPRELPLALAEAFEDAASAFLKLADLVSRQHRGGQLPPRED
ncbi:hypothetical protein [Afifella pfennigii]|uniref:hypothetical protein n=1 Tax=Afifella pfennigii TaxID=209897 RepID=UPI000479586B|nr:hypothetical protein [Afifella pfennigii]